MPLASYPCPSMSLFPHRRRITAAFCLVLPLWLISNTGLADQACRIASFTPTAETPVIRQALMTFATDAVGFGDPRAKDAPFLIQCPEAGQGHWLDTKTWVYDFARDLPAGVACTFTLRPDFTCLGDKKPTGETQFRLSTGGPTILETRPDRYGIAEDSAIALKLNGKVDAASVQEHVYFRVNGMASKIPVQIITGPQRQQVLTNIHRYRSQAPSAEELSHYIIIQAKRPFPADTKIDLVWDKGVRSASGVPRQQAQILEFQVRQPFRATVTCEREKADAACIPLANINVNFSSPVPAALMRQAVLRGPQGKVWKPSISDSITEVYSLTFKAPFPPQSALSLTLPAGVKDIYERPLSNADKFPLDLQTGEAPALLKFPGTFGLLESQADPVLPVTVRKVESILNGESLPLRDRSGLKGTFNSLVDAVRVNVFRSSNAKAQDIMGWLNRVHMVSREHSVFAPWPRREGEKDGDDNAEDMKDIKPAVNLTLPSKDQLKPLRIPRQEGAKDMEVIGLPMKEPGFYVVELASPDLGRALLGKEATMYVATSVLVTNMSVHVKRGRDNTLVWVTSLDKGNPVPGALITVSDCQGKTYANGKTGGEGFLIFDTPLPNNNEIPRCGKDWGSYQTGLLFVAEKGSDMSFTHSSWDQGIESWRFHLPTSSWQSTYAVHTVFDRTLIKAGETLHFKTFVRQRLMRGFGAIPATQRPKTLRLNFPALDQSWDVPLTWVNDGAAVGQWTVPQDAKTGTYQSWLSLPGSSGRGRENMSTGSFRVDEYRIPLARGQIVPPAAPQVRPKTVDYDLSVNYLNGGGADGLPVRFRARLSPGASIHAPDFEDFQFANGSVKPGLSREDETDSQTATKSQDIFNKELSLDKAGGQHVTVTIPSTDDRPASLATELEFRDPNGEIQTVSRDISLWPGNYVVGLKSDAWAMAKEKLRLTAAVIDRQGRGVKGQTVNIRLHTRKTYSHRKKILGGFYSYENRVEIGPAIAFCTGTTDTKGLMSCEQSTSLSGEVIAVASVGGSAAQKSFWLRGEDDWWFSQDDHDRMDLLPESKRYEPGDKARLQVRMPFREATALVAVEREGVLRARVQTLSGKAPVVDIPVENDDAPNVYVSVLAVRGREDAPKPSGMVDLAKPAYKLGIAGFHVGYQRHQLRVEVKTDKASYRVREKGMATIKVSLPGQSLPKDADVSLAIVDNGLLQLRSNQSWQLLDAMMGERPYLIETATNQGSVIGKRHYGKKAVADGGGGGTALTRTLFDPLILWQGSVKLDDKGEARIPFTLNDSLSSFKVAAIASAGLAYFGTGMSDILSTQDIMLLPGIPPSGRHGEEQTLTVTLRNTTARAMPLKANLEAKEAKVEKATQDLELPAHASTTIQWPVRLPEKGATHSYQISVAAGQQVLDRLAVTQKLSAPVPVQTLQATLTQVSAQNPVTMPITAPAGRIPQLGGIEVNFSPSLLGNVGEVRSYMQDYPYSCLEQQLSKAVALDDRKKWDEIMKVLPAYLDGAGFARFFMGPGEGSPLLSAYLLQLAHETNWPVPTNEKEAMLTGLERFARGEVTSRGVFPFPDLVLRKLTALEAISRFKQLSPELLSSIEDGGNSWPSSALLDWYAIYWRSPELPQRKAILARTRDTILARLNYSGTRLSFATEDLDKLWWLWATPENNAMRLILLNAEDKDFLADPPKLMQGLLGRLRQDGTWGGTHDNAMGMLAVRFFARRYETSPVAGESRATLAKVSQSLHWDQNKNGKTLALPFPPDKDDLQLQHQGSGAPWATVASRAAVPISEARFAGLRMERQVKALRQQTPGQWHIGDVMEVTISITSPTDLAWVVVSDPIPSGATILGGELNQGPRSLGDHESSDQDLYPSFRENLTTGHRAYFEYMPKGTWRLRYRFRVNNAGHFLMPPSHAEAMYAPEIYADVPIEAQEVLP